MSATQSPTTIPVIVRPRGRAKPPTTAQNPAIPPVVQNNRIPGVATPHYPMPIVTAKSTTLNVTCSYTC